MIIAVRSTMRVYVMQGLDPQGFLSGRALYLDVEQYAGFGEHRTGTEVDRRTARWLKEKLEGVGVTVELDPFHVPQFFPEKVSLRVDGKAIACFPMWPPKTTGSAGVSGTMGKANADGSGDCRGKLAVVAFPAGAASTPRSGHAAIVNALAKAGAAAVIGVTPSIPGELVAQNSARGDDPWPVPVVLVGTKDEAALEEGAHGELVLTGRSEARAVAQEVIGRLERGKKWMVVSTPYSGWFRCAGERGPGIALWLGVARWAAHHRSESSYLFVASSAHELGYRGAAHFLETKAPKPAEVTAWIHLGAGIACYEWEATPRGPRRLDRPYGRRRLLSNREDVVALLGRTFGGVPGLKPQLTDRAEGEVAMMFAKGYRALGFEGAHPWHHLPGDVPEKTTSAELLGPVGAALLETLEALERT